MDPLILSFCLIFQTDQNLSQFVKNHLAAPAPICLRSNATKWMYYFVKLKLNFILWDWVLVFHQCENTLFSITFQVCSTVKDNLIVTYSLSADQDPIKNSKFFVQPC